MKHARWSNALVDRWSDLILLRPAATILLLVASVVALSTQLGKLHIESHMLAYIPHDDTVRTTYDESRLLFDAGERIGLVIETEDVFDSTFLLWLRDLHHQFNAELPHVDKISSLINPRDTHTDGDLLTIDDLMDPWPDTDEALSRIKERALANPLLARTLLSDNHRITALHIELNTYSDSTNEQGIREYLSHAEIDQFLAHLRELIDQHRDQGFDIHLIGSAVHAEELNRVFAQKTSLLSMLTYVVIGVLVFVLFRRVSAVIFCLSLAALTVLIAFAFMATIGQPIYSTTQSVPPLLIAISVASSVHLLAAFYHGSGDGMQREAAIRHALKKVGTPILLANLTTAAGMASFIISDVMPLRCLGIIAPIAICYSTILNLALLPALLQLCPIKPCQTAESPAWSIVVEGWLVRVSMHSLRRPAWIIACFSVLVSLALVGISKIHFTMDTTRWLDIDNPIRQGIEKYDHHLAGNGDIEILLDTGIVDGIKEPQLLQALEREVLWLQNEPEIAGIKVRKVNSVNDVVKELHQVISDDKPAGEAIPQSSALLAQELLLYEISGNQDIYALTDQRFSVARIIIRFADTDANLVIPFSQQVSARMEEKLGQYGHISVTGTYSLLTATVMNVIATMLESYGLALVVICGLMILMLGSLRLGVTSMAPNIVPIILTLGIAGYLSIGFDMNTITVGSVVLGLAVDDTIHYLSTVRHHLATGKSIEQAVRETVTTTGRALCFTSIILGVAFLVNLCGGTEPIINFGIVASTAIFIAFITDICLIPALLALTYSQQQSSADDSLHPDLQAGFD